MKLAWLLKLLFPVTMLTLVSCTLHIGSARDPEQGTGLGSGVVNIEDTEGNLLATCTFTSGVAQADCVQQIEPGSTVVLKPVADSDSAFVAWSAPPLPIEGSTGDVGAAEASAGCVLVLGDNCTVVFFNPVVDRTYVTAYFKRLSCQGTDACTDLVNSPAGEGSCNGDTACQFATGPIGNNSCNSKHTCWASSGRVGNNSCNSNFAVTSACVIVVGPVGDNSCNFTNACLQADGPVGNNSCNSISACTSSTGIGNASCNGQDACQDAADSVGDDSCNDFQACHQATGPTGNNSCNGVYACDSAAGPIGNNSCNGDNACEVANVSIGNNSCNTTGTMCSLATEPIGDCMYNDVKPDACP